MASSSSVVSSRLLFLLFITYIVFSSSKVEAQVDETRLKLMMSDALEWPLSMSLYSEEGDGDIDEEEEEEKESGYSRRSLFWKRMKYYISYGALSANRIPCPPRSGRSYYTQNCFKAHGPVHPYTRGCSKITRCRR
ncbi:Rapid ALkalinization Factor [Corchorus olitorius]|uniref:Rapid ALkalinization Factor n=1 Tax=Corchorus olitorius TaxID=93759 RepID=A0A1R3K4T2_9ROSI|nr:Rapid ALkalinization Factor [Corchorus olitorius]